MFLRNVSSWRFEGDVEVPCSGRLEPSTTACQLDQRLVDGR